MDKMIPLKIQKIIIFIPIVNFAIFFIWVWNFKKSGKDNILLYKSAIYAVIAAMFLGLFGWTLSVLTSAFPDVIKAYSYITKYTTPLVVGAVMIWCQRNMLSDCFKDK